MLFIHPVPFERLEELRRAQGAPASMFCCEAEQDGQSEGFVLFDGRGGVLTVTALCCAEGLADALLRAAFNAGQMAGMTRFAFSTGVADLWRGTLRRLAYPLEGGEIEAFFARGGCGCHGAR